MTILWILLPLAALAALAGGVYMLRYTCVCKKTGDLWDPAVLERRGFGALRESIAAGRAWMEAQTVEPLECVSYDGLILRGRLIPRAGAKGAILLFHGWRSSWKLDFTSILPYLASLGYTLLLVDERAQGDSQGRYMTYGVRERRDAASWVTCMAQLYGGEFPLFLHGLSMGATTVLMASCSELDGNVRGVIADCGFSSPRDIMENVMSYLPRWLLRLELGWLDVFTRVFAGFSLGEASTVDAVARTALPILFIHGTADTFVPPQMTRSAYDACRSEKTLLLVEGAGHGLSYPTAPERVRGAVTAFLEKHNP